MAVFSKFITSERGGRLLVDTDDFIYSQRSTKSATTTSWRCQQFSKLKCCARITMCNSDSSITEGLHAHNHPPCPARWTMLASQASMIQRAGQLFPNRFSVQNTFLRVML